MPTYVYETIPERSNEKPTRFELRQSIKDTPVSEHPDTGQAVRRVISGGILISAKRDCHLRAAIVAILHQDHVAHEFV